MDQRAFIADWLRDEWTMSALAERYGISRKTAYKWVERYDADPAHGLAERSRAPKRHGRAMAEDVQRAVLTLRRAYPRWGPKKLRAVLGAREPGRPWPAQSTMGDLLRREGGESAAPPHAVCRAVDAAPLAAAQVPNDVRTAETPFATTGAGHLSQLAVWWLKLGIQLDRIDPGHPEQNGRHERFHLTSQEETTSPPAATARQQQTRFDRMRGEFNTERPHEALGQQPPARVWTHETFAGFLGSCPARPVKSDSDTEAATLSLSSLRGNRLNPRSSCNLEQNPA